MKLRIKISVLLALLLIVNSRVYATEPKLIFGPGYTKDQIDTSIKLKFNPPDVFIEKPEKARENGLYKFYELPLPDDLPTTYFTVAFQKTDIRSEISLKEFVNRNSDLFKQICPNAVVSLVLVPENIAENFTKNNIPHVMFFYTSNSEEYPDSLVFFFETHDGFWSIAWNTFKELVVLKQAVFLDFIKHIEIEVVMPLNQENTK